MPGTVIADIRNNHFPALTIQAGTWVVWRNLDPVAHSAERLRNKEPYFSAGPLLPGETSSPIHFETTGVFDYVCRYHHDMSGSVTVLPAGAELPPLPSNDGHGDHSGSHGGHGGLKHLHGFVTGGRSGNRFFMTHTPVLADSRHNYQVILQGSLVNAQHAAAYSALRAGPYADGKVQIFHEHVALPDIGSGVLTELPKSSFEYYPNDPDGTLGGTEVPGLEGEIPVRIDKVIHFHQFQTDAEYPESMTYIIYGDENDVFLDHYIDRAPSFHSVSRLKALPTFFTGGAQIISIPSKQMIDVSPKILRRVAQVDNAFHLYWLPPTGIYPLPADPLKKRDSTSPVYQVKVGGQTSTIEIGRFLHFDVRLLNHGVLIVS
jgi:hypothetical protein